MDRDADLEIHYADEWAALYKNGKLVQVGDSYLAEEAALRMLGVTIVQDDAFMRGQDHRDGVAQDLDEVDEYRWSRSTRKETAAAKRAEAERLLAEARELES